MSAALIIGTLILEAIIIILLFWFLGVRSRGKKIKMLADYVQELKKSDEERLKLLTQFITHKTKFEEPEKIAPQVIHLEGTIYQEIVELLLNFKVEQLTALEKSIERLSLLNQDISFDEDASDEEEAALDMSMEEDISED
ncbi:hypothetical protein [Piscirickettsia litoralis]|uniref:Uncharacterized protein n=1 Tax=Piscirickettsia litoralis TaxID=1891921 RepID=A0ABX3A3Y0_9GAMM|nr:hypothetical protein [Piscirickettsia litoralis]ODN42145.1 hypothetical protein BGC07_03265 [Piscirickettsia litoralis]